MRTIMLAMFIISQFAIAGKPPVPVGSNQKGKTNTTVSDLGASTKDGQPSGTIYTIPFASGNNTIELNIENASATEPSDITVSLRNPPAWLHIVPDKILTKTIKPGGSDSVTFTYSLDKFAPVKKTEELHFLLKSKSGESWTKTISISIAAPNHYELFQNYPNPFNPITTIEYQLPEEAKVIVKVYNILGQEVATLVNETQTPGYKKAKFDAGNFGSGVYFYRIQAGTFNSIKKMIAVK